MSDTDTGVGMQQHGPSTQIDGRYDNIIDMLRQEIMELRSMIAKQQGAVAGAERVSRGSSQVTLGSAQSVLIPLEEAGHGSAKLLSAVNALAPPGNAVWAGDKDQRSARRFLALVTNAGRASGLDAEGMTRYFLNRCVNADLRDELNDDCFDLFSSGDIDYKTTTPVDQQWMARGNPPFKGT